MTEKNLFGRTMNICFLLINTNCTAVHEYLYRGVSPYIYFAVHSSGLWKTDAAARERGESGTSTFIPKL